MSSPTSSTTTPSASATPATPRTQPTSSLPPPKIIIIGAGLTGPLLAQSLLHHAIPFSLHERDPAPDHRGAGWGLTLHWALPAFLSLLPEKLRGEALGRTYVNPLASSRGEDGNFLLFDLHTREELWRVPPNRRIRCRREGVRRLLMTDLDICWGDRVVDVRSPPPGESGVEVCFENGRTERGALVVGCDGSRSRVREVLCPQTYRNHPLPVRLLGVSCVYPAAKARAMRGLDPFFLQARDRETGVFFWFSFLDAPEIDPPREDDTYTCQILTSYPFRPGFLGEVAPIEVPDSAPERLKLMKRFAASWAEPFRSAVLDIPEGTEVKQIRLEDWKIGEEERREWERSKLRGRVTLVGDAAHAMTMYRGEAANHGILDTFILLTYLLPALQSPYHASLSDRQTAIEEAVKSYEEELWSRTPQAVELSSRACLDAHAYGAGIHENSPLVARRAVKLAGDGRGDGGIAADAK